MRTTTGLLAKGHDFINALSSLDVNRMLSLRTSDCHHVILPKSLGRNPMSNDEFRDLYTDYLALAKFSNYNIKIHAEMVDERLQKVVLYASGSAETLAGPFQSEYIFILTMVDNDGSLEVSQVEEFVDSKLSADEGAKIRSAITKAQEK